MYWQIYVIIAESCNRHCNFLSKFFVNMLKIKRIREFRNLTQDALSALSGVKKRSLVDYENGKSDIPFSKLQNIAKALGTSVSELIDDADFVKSNTILSSNIEKGIVLKDDIIIPVYDLKSTIGLIPFRNDNGTIDEGKIIEYITVSQITSCDGAIYAISDSMYPLLNSGDIIVYKNIEVDCSRILFGKMYLLAIKINDNETVKVIKYIYPSEFGVGYIKLVCNNEKYPDKDVELKEIVAIGMIKASIKFHI